MIVVMTHQPLVLDSVIRARSKSGAHIDSHSGGQIVLDMIKNRLYETALTHSDSHSDSLLYNALNRGWIDRTINIRSQKKQYTFLFGHGLCDHFFLNLYFGTISTQDLS